ncbi:YqgE/AlgH family protein [Corynebacterium uberis]|uniref:YqgE/AlgH family protein n=1 Tax=Corynebacterium TaxID=1716 RepID=UPI001D0B53E4|nr:MULTISPECIES: YqgE/AlgH family protein [Corynebacterium]MCZ9310168.1 YqgE/AlgH family protein [Corynebacterium sp. c6VSa_13]UDL73307.1 YqgE/AlgH family protein [Corynebacterium uberis]UDL75815.1 YqgE/AlgH family protein [Corynebacterium uberis]UDL78028.1 YqgE/AlgH family protein [Corynebacterium uberis]UDL80310.1 YqgE/AlgH family protein [Corynebacterium uberis]
MAEEFFADRLFNALERNDPGPGMLLVSAPGIESLDFTRSVVVLIDHSTHGTYGVDLTRRSDVAVDNYFDFFTPVVSKPQAFYVGGPVRGNTVLGLGVTRPGLDISVHPHLIKLANRLVYIDLGADPDELKEQLEGMRLFMGVAQWEPGQLHEEIERGDWYVAPALPGDVIAPAGADLWADVMRRQQLPLPLVATFPSDPEDN